jgi:hypothetical protein
MVPDILENAHENKHLGGEVLKSTLSRSCISLNSGELLVNVMIMHDTTTDISRTLKNTSA